MDTDQRRCLLLTPWYLPHKVIKWEDAICLMYTGKADSVVDYDARVSSPSTTLAIPAVLRLRRPLRSMKRGVRFSRINVYTRDGYRCQYCGRKCTHSELSYDHVVPRAAGGRTTWDNIVTCCKPCNKRKGSRSCDDAGMWPRIRPVEPKSLPHSGPRLWGDQPPEWEPFLTVMGDP